MKDYKSLIKIMFFPIGILVLLGIRHLYKTNTINGVVAFFITVFIMIFGEILYHKYFKKR